MWEANLIAYELNWKLGVYAPAQDFVVVCVCVYAPAQDFVVVCVCVCVCVCMCVCMTTL
jgi:hypothetical protein